jgi:hypothetical protein
MDIPYNIKSLLEGNNISNATGLSGQGQPLEESYHYTAFIKKDVKSLIEINADITNSVLDIKNNLLERDLIHSDDIIFIHFPPSIWRLHIHFVDKNHKFTAPEYEIFYLSEITQNLINDKYYYLKNVTIRNKL